MQRHREPARLHAGVPPLFPFSLLSSPMPRASVCSCRDCPSVEIMIVFAITALINIHVSISIPSLWSYTQQLGGNQTTYGIAASGSFVSAVIMLPIFGYLGDRYSPKKIFLLTFVAMAVGLLLGTPLKRIHLCQPHLGTRPAALRNLPARL